MAYNKRFTEDEENEVCRLFFEEHMQQKEIAKLMGCSQSTVSVIVNKPERIASLLKTMTAERVRAQMKINAHLLEAADTQIELMHGDYEDQYKYLKQNAARDLLDRGGVRVEKEEKPDVNITLDFGEGGSFDLGVPDHSMDNEGE